MSYKRVIGQSLLRKLGEMFRVSQLSLMLSEAMVISFDALLLATEQVSNTQTLNMNSASAVKGQTCPAGERWYIMDVWQDSTTGGKTAFYLFIKGVRMPHVFGSTTAAVLSQNFDGYELSEGDYFTFQGTNNPADTAVETVVSYRKLLLNQ